MVLRTPDASTSSVARSVAPETRTSFMTTPAEAVGTTMPSVRAAVSSQPQSSVVTPADSERHSDDVR